MTRGLRVFGHPVHAVLSDFPVALLGTSLVWDAVGLWRGESVWWAISFWGIALGLAAAGAAATAGAVDYAAIPQDDPALATANRHMLFVLAAVVPYIASLIVRRGPDAPASGTTLVLVLLLEASGVLLLSIGGWYGGHLVFHHGVGRSDDARPAASITEPHGEGKGPHGDVMTAASRPARPSDFAAPGRNKEFKGTAK